MASIITFYFFHRVTIFKIFTNTLKHLTIIDIMNKNSTRKCIKCPYKDILHPNENYSKLINIINSHDRIKSYGDLFIRSFLLDTFENNTITDLKIDQEFIRCAFSVICRTDKPKRGKPVDKKKKNIIDILTTYWNSFKEKTGMESLSSLNLSYVLGQTYKQIHISIINNIKYNYDKHLWAYIKASFNNEYIDAPKKKLFYTEMNKIKNDLLNNTQTSDNRYHKWIKDNKTNIVPITYTENKFETDVVKNTFKYLKCMHYINNYLQINSFKSYQIYPIKTKCYQQYIKINTSALIEIFAGTNLLNDEPKNKYLSKAGDNEIQEKIWNKVFRLKDNDDNYLYKRKGYSFNYEIETDGFGVSLNFIDDNEKPNKEKKKKNFEKGRNKTNVIKASKSAEEYDLYQKQKKDIEHKKNEEQLINLKAKKRERSKQIKKMSLEEKAEHKKLMNDLKEFPYIEQLLTDKNIREQFLEEFNAGHVLLGDPGMRSIIYFMAANNHIQLKQKNLQTNNFGVSIWDNKSLEIDDNGKHKIEKHKSLNYTSKTRTLFLKGNHYTKLRESWKNQRVDDKKSLKEVELELSQYNSKICNNNEFIKYVKKKLEYDNKAHTEYNTLYLRKLKWYTYLNKNKHENDLLNHIQNEFGNKLSNGLSIILGDWSRGNHIRYKSVPNISLRRKLAERFNVYSIDEYLTSKIHYKYKIKCKNLKIKQNQENIDNTTQSKNFLKKLHAVLTYKIANTEVACKPLEMGCINRDKNSVLNMETIVTELLKSGTRPTIFSRQTNQTDQLAITGKPVLMPEVQIGTTVNQTISNSSKKSTNKKKSKPKKVNQPLMSKPGNKTKLKINQTIKPAKNKKVN